MKKFVSLVVALVAFAVVGAAHAKKEPNPSGGGATPPAKVTVCLNGVTMEVNLNAVAALVAQGASLDACPDPDPGPQPPANDGGGAQAEPPACELGGAVANRNPKCDEDDESTNEERIGPANEPPACELGNSAVDQNNPTCEDAEEEPGNDDSGNDDSGNDDSGDQTGTPPVVKTSGSSSTESSRPRGPARQLYCVNGRMVDVPVGQADGELYPQATAARFYAGLGASCDLLPAYVATGLWVDPSGTLVIPAEVAALPWVVAYPFYARA